jgi:hypothetical protein
MSYKEKYLKYKKKYIDLKQKSIIKGGKPIHYFNDNVVNPDIYYIDLSDQSHITSINNNFCRKCINLRYINLSPLSNITTIGDNFMLDCTNLTSIDLSALTQLTTIGADFMFNCSKLISIDLSALTQLNHIDNNFMYGCESLTSIDLSKLDRLETIGNYFLENCTSLTSIDLSKLKQLKTIGPDFLSNCIKLIEIKCTRNQIKILRKSNKILLRKVEIKIVFIEEIYKKNSTKHPKIVVQLYGGTASLMSNHRRWKEDDFYLPDQVNLNIINEKYYPYNHDPNFYDKLSNIDNWESPEIIPNCMRDTYDGPWQYALLYELDFKTNSPTRDAKEFITAINQSQNQKNSYGEWEICAILKGENIYKQASFISGNIKLIESDH